MVSNLLRRGHTSERAVGFVQLTLATLGLVPGLSVPHRMIRSEYYSPILEASSYGTDATQRSSAE